MFRRINRIQNTRLLINPSQLAITFNKSAGAIRSRLRHLEDPNHDAYQRLAQIVDLEIDNYEY